MVWLRATGITGNCLPARPQPQNRVGRGARPLPVNVCPSGLLGGRRMGFGMIPLYLQGNISNEKGRAGPESKGVRRRGVGGTGKADGG